MTMANQDPKGIIPDDQFRNRYKTSNYQRRPTINTRPRSIDDFKPFPNYARSYPMPVRNLSDPAPITFEPVAAPITKKWSLPNAKTGIVATAVLVFIAGLAISIQGFKANQKVNAEAKKISAKTSSTSLGSNPPDESKPSLSAIKSYTVAPDLPKLITIPKIYVKARVQRVSVNSNNQLQTARNLFDVGWYDNSSKPGDAAGAVLIDGHDLGLTSAGVFNNLKKLQPGDEIQITRGDNKIFKFGVVNTKVYDANNVDMNAALTSAVPGKLGLNLITCTGQFDSNKVQFQQRLMVFAATE